MFQYLLTDFIRITYAIIFQVDILLNTFLIKLSNQYKCCSTYVLLILCTYYIYYDS